MYKYGLKIKGVEISVFATIFDLYSVRLTFSITADGSIVQQGNSWSVVNMFSPLRKYTECQYF